MTQAFNLSQLANNVDTNGDLNAATGLYNQVPVANGGTGASTLTANAVLIGNGTSAVTAVAAGTAGNVLTSNGTTWNSSSFTAGTSVNIMTVATGSGTWTKPATVKSIKVTVLGGGGAGAAGSLTPVFPGTPIHRTGGGGGAGGSAIRFYPAASLPGPQPYTVGGATATSSFGVAPITVVSATGGANASNVTGGLGGVGSNGNININGGNGNGGIRLDITPSAAFLGAGGQGGASIFGANGSGTPTDGTGGGSYGGGGGGGSNNPPFGSAGGAGASGVVIIEEFY